jgi:hypothetical protein
MDSPENFITIMELEPPQRAKDQVFPEQREINPYDAQRAG